MPTNNDNDEIVIDMMDLGRYLLHQIKYFILAGIVCTALTLFVTVFFIAPKYTSTTKLLVLNRQMEGTITNSDLQGSTMLTKDYVELIKSRTVLEAVIAQLDLNMKYENLLSMISVSSQTDTRIVTIQVTDTDPYEASEKANAIREAATTHILAGMDTVTISTVDMANIPEQKSSPSIKKNIFIADFAVLALLLVIFVVKYILDDKVKDSEDVTHYLGLSVLGVIPINENDVKEKKKE